MADNGILRIFNAASPIERHHRGAKSRGWLMVKSIISSSRRLGILTGWGMINRLDDIAAILTSRQLYHSLEAAMHLKYRISI